MTWARVLLISLQVTIIFLDDTHQRRTWSHICCFPVFVFPYVPCSFWILLLCTLMKTALHIFLVTSKIRWFVDTFVKSTEGYCPQFHPFSIAQLYFETKDLVAWFELTCFENPHTVCSKLQNVFFLSTTQSNLHNSKESAEPNRFELSGDDWASWTPTPTTGRLSWS